MALVLTDYCLAYLYLVGLDSLGAAENYFWGGSTDLLRLVTLMTVCLRWYLSATGHLIGSFG